MVWSCIVCSDRCLLEGGSQFSLKYLSQLWGCRGLLPVCSVRLFIILMLFILHSFYNKWSVSWILLFLGVLKLCWNWGFDRDTGRTWTQCNTELFSSDKWHRINGLLYFFLTKTFLSTGYQANLSCLYKQC